MIEKLYNNMKKTPQKLCVVDEKEEYTYEEFWGQIENFAGVFKLTYKLCKGDKAVVECTQDARFLVIHFALNLIGVIFVPVEMNVSDERLNDIMNETGAKAYISATDVIDVENVIFDKNTLVFPAEDDIAEILYTTGTTGKSKGIVLTHANNIAVAENIIDGTKMSPDNVELIPLPISHSHGLRTCYANLLNGSTVVLVNGVMRVKKWINLLRKYNVSALDLSPTAARALIKVTRGDMSTFVETLDYVEIGTAALDEDLKEELCNLLPQSRLYNFYGSTESGRVCTYDFNAEKGLKNCIGYPTKNAFFVVTDDDRNEMNSSGENQGLLSIKGPMNMKEYFNSENLTKETLREGFIFTNDIGYIDDTGKVFMVGRKGNVINYLGIKISPEEIESIAMKCACIIDCACVPAKDSNGLEVPKLYVVMKNREDSVKQEVRDFLKQGLEANKMPQIIEVIEEIPRASNGKILRNQLMERK